MTIHPAAIVDRSARLGCEVSVGAYAVIGPEVTLGDRVRVSSHVVVDGRTTIGEDGEILPFAMVGAPPGHLKDRGDGTELVIGARVSIREHASLHRGTKLGSGRTSIGDGCTFFAHSHVGHDCVVGNGVLLTNGTQLGGHVQVEDFVVFGGSAAVHQFCRIGTMAMIEGHAGIVMDVPPYCLSAGARGRLVGLNEVGLERRGVPADTVKALRSAYRVVFRSGLKRERALARVCAELDGIREVAHFIDFIAAPSKRGIARHGRD